MLFLKFLKGGTFRIFIELRNLSKVSIKIMKTPPKYHQFLRSFLFQVSKIFNLYTPQQKRERSKQKIKKFQLFAKTFNENANSPYLSSLARNQLSLSLYCLVCWCLWNACWSLKLCTAPTWKRFERENGGLRKRERHLSLLFVAQFYLISHK